MLGLARSFEVLARQALGRGQSRITNTSTSPLSRPRHMDSAVCERVQHGRFAGLKIVDVLDLPAAGGVNDVVIADLVRRLDRLVSNIVLAADGVNKDESVP